MQTDYYQQGNISSALNPAQLYLLQVFSSFKDEKEARDIQNLLLDYYQKKVDAASDNLWDEMQLTDAKMDELMYGHQRFSGK
jgi:hypothetical protein